MSKLYDVVKKGGAIPLGDYFVVIDPRQGYYLMELYVTLAEEYTTFTPREIIRKEKVIEDVDKVNKGKVELL